MWRFEGYSGHFGGVDGTRGFVSIGVFCFIVCKLLRTVQNRQKRQVWTPFLPLYKPNENNEKLNKTRIVIEFYVFVHKIFFSTPGRGIFVIKLLIKASVGKVFLPARPSWLLMQKWILVMMRFYNLKKNPLKFYWVYFIKC